MNLLDFIRFKILGILLLHTHTHTHTHTLTHLYWSRMDATAGLVLNMWRCPLGVWN